MSEHEQAPRLTDAELIAQGIEWAQHAERVITPTTARVIAAQLHEGQDSALYSFASSGAVDKARLGPELAGTYIQPDTPDEVKTWVEEFGRYLEETTDRGPVDAWNSRHGFDHTPSVDTENHCASCNAHISEPHEPGCIQGDDYADL